MFKGRIIMLILLIQLWVVCSKLILCFLVCGSLLYSLMYYFEISPFQYEVGKG